MYVYSCTCTNTHIYTRTFCDEVKTVLKMASGLVSMCCVTVGVEPDGMW